MYTQLSGTVINQICSDHCTALGSKSNIYIISMCYIAPLWIFYFTSSRSLTSWSWLIFLVLYLVETLVYYSRQRQRQRQRQSLLFKTKTKTAPINSRLNLVVRSPALFGLGQTGCWPSQGCQLPWALPFIFSLCCP